MACDHHGLRGGPLGLPGLPQALLKAIVLGVAGLPPAPDSRAGCSHYCNVPRAPLLQFLNPTTECKLATCMRTRAAQITRTFARYSKADVCPPLLSELPRFNRGLLQPVGHAHFTVHRHRGGEVLLRLLAIAPPAVKFAETEVAVSDQRTHAAVLS
jgi:hypothetical protein